MPISAVIHHKSIAFVLADIIKAFDLIPVKADFTSEELRSTKHKLKRVILRINVLNISAGKLGCLPADITHNLIPLKNLDKSGQTILQSLEYSDLTETAVLIKRFLRQAHGVAEFFPLPTEKKRITKSKVPVKSKYPRPMISIPTLRIAQ